jgi:hypothetical protein
MHGDSRGQIFNSESLEEFNSKKQINTAYGRKCSD